MSNPGKKCRQSKGKQETKAKGAPKAGLQCFPHGRDYAGESGPGELVFRAHIQRDGGHFSLKVIHVAWIFTVF